MSSGGQDSGAQDESQRTERSRRRTRVPLRQPRREKEMDPDETPLMFRGKYKQYWENVRRGKGGGGREEQVERTVRQARKSAEKEGEGGDRGSDEQDGQDAESYRADSKQERFNRRIVQRRYRRADSEPPGSDDGAGSGRAGRGRDPDVRVQRIKESEGYEKEAYARLYPYFMKCENDASEKLKRILNEGDMEVAKTYIPDFMNSVNDMSIAMKNIYEEYASMFFRSLPGGIDKYAIRKHLFDGLSEYMRMYVFTDKAIVTSPLGVVQKIRDDVRDNYIQRWTAPTGQEEESHPAPEPAPEPRGRERIPPRSRSRRARGTRPRTMSPEPEADDNDSERGRPSSLLPKSDEIYESSEEKPPSEPQPGRMERFRVRGSEAARGMWNKIRNASKKAQGYRPFSQEPASALTGAPPHNQRMKARAARRLEKMGYYKAEGSFLATPFSLDVLPVLESAASVHGGQPAAQVAAEQQAEGHRRVPVPPAGAGDL